MSNKPYLPNKTVTEKPLEFPHFQQWKIYACKLLKAEHGKPRNQEKACLTKCKIVVMWRERERERLQ